jgi:hypothetical protein
MAAALTFDAEAHRYTLNGKRVPSVTQVLSVLEDWDKVPWDVLEAARVFGSHVHDAVDLMIRGILDWDALDAALLPYVQGAQRFIADSGIRIVRSELRVAHPTLGFAGTMDVLADWTGNLSVIDWKSGVLPRAVGPQTAAYAEAYAAMHGEKVKRRHCVQLNPEFQRGYKVHPLTRTTDWHIFQSCLNVHRFKYAT